MSSLPPVLSYQQVTDALDGFPSYRAPASLYRFHSKAGLPALTEGKLKITPPNQFNDPFELLPGIVVNGLSAEDLRRSFLSPCSLARAVFAKKRKDEQDYRNWVEGVVVRAMPLWGKHLDTMRNTVIGATSDTYGICSFAAFPETVLNGPLGIRHWAMYAKDHTGFVIEYDGQNSLLSSWATIKWLFPVVYHDKRPIVSIAEFDEWTQEKVVQILRHWSEMKCKQAWGEESEWRLLCPLRPDPEHRAKISSKRFKGRKQHFLHLWENEAPVGRRDARAIKRVILGLRVDPELEAKIRATLTSPEFQHVQLYRVALSDPDFALRTEPAKL